MRRIELQELSLRNFKGVRQFDLTLNGQSATVSGANKAGKTTLSDAYQWLLFEKDSAGRKDFDIKTLDATGKALPALDHEVEATFLVDGTELNLRRVYAEKYTKKRGGSKAEFTGHETSHFVAGVPVTKGEYSKTVSELLDEATWRLLSDPAAFQALHWKERREIVLNVTGDVSDADVIASDPSLKSLPEILGNRTLDEHRKVVAARRAELNDELQKLPIRIDEVARGLPDVAELVAEELDAALVAARAEREAAAEQLATARAGHGDASALRRELQDVEGQLLSLERAAADEAQAGVRKARAALQEAEQSERDGQARITRLESQWKDAQADVDRLHERIADMRQEWARVNSQKIEAHVEDTCAACQQALPADRVAEAHQRAVADLNARKARELERISSEGKDLASRLERAVEEVAELELSKGEQAAVVTKAGEALQAAQQAVEAAQAAQGQPKDAATTPAYAKLASERDDLQRRINALATGDDSALTELQRAATKADARIQDVQASLALIKQHEAGTTRIEELKADEKKLSAEWEELERQLHLMDEFTRTRVAMLESRVAEKFSVVNFRLFKQQVNGGLDETCDITVDGVPWDDVNHAGQIAAGLDIIRTLQAHHQVSTPVFIDQAESIHDIPDTGAQQVALIVSPKDKKLRVETHAVEGAVA